METSKPANGIFSSTDNAANRPPIQFGSEAQGTIDKTTANTQVAVDRVAAGAHTAIEKMSVAAADMSEKLSIKGKELLATQERLMAKGREQVKESPATSMAIALAAGILIGKLLGLRK